MIGKSEIMPDFFASLYRLMIRHDYDMRGSKHLPLPGQGPQRDRRARRSQRSWQQKTHCRKQRFGANRITTTTVQWSSQSLFAPEFLNKKVHVDHSRGPCPVSEFLPFRKPAHRFPGIAEASATSLRTVGGRGAPPTSSHIRFPIGI